MDLKSFLKALPDDDIDGFARKCGTTAGHIRNVSYGLRLAAPALCVAIERSAGGVITRRDLRPDDWHLIWPELITADHPAPTPAEAAA